MLYYKMHAMVDTKEEVYHAILDAEIRCSILCTLHPNSYFHSFYETGWLYAVGY